MQKFFEKYINTFEAKDAVKFIEKHVDKAKELCKEDDSKYLDHLAIAYNMIQDYFSEQGLDIRNF